MSALLSAEAALGKALPNLASIPRCHGRLISSGMLGMAFENIAFSICSTVSALGPENVSAASS